MKISYNEHLNPRPYPRAHHVKFHIQFAYTNTSLCGRILFPHSYSIFSPAFFFRFEVVNQCPDCVQVFKEFQQSAESADSQSLSN